MRLSRAWPHHYGSGRSSLLLVVSSLVHSSFYDCLHPHVQKAMHFKWQVLRTRRIVPGTQQQLPPVYLVPTPPLQVLCAVPNRLVILLL